MSSQSHSNTARPNPSLIHANPLPEKYRWYWHCSLRNAIHERNGISAVDGSPITTLEDHLLAQVEFRVHCRCVNSDCASSSQGGHLWHTFSTRLSPANINGPSYLLIVLERWVPRRDIVDFDSQSIDVPIILDVPCDVPNNEVPLHFIFF